MIAAEPAPSAGRPAGRPFDARQILLARELLARLSGARRAVRFYPPGHVAVRDSVAALMAVILEFHRDGADVPLIFYDNEVLLGEQLLATESVMFDQLIRDMSAGGRTSVVFRRGLEAEELEHAMVVLSDVSSTSGEGSTGALDTSQLPHVEIGSVTVARDGGDAAEGAADTPPAVRSRALDVMRDYDRELARGRTPSSLEAVDAVTGIVDGVLRDRTSMIGMAVLKRYDEYTFFHSVNVAILSVGLGSLISRNTRFLNSLGVGALLHDIGKMTVELQVLNKIGKLSPQEWELMQMHPQRGAEVAARMRGLDRSSIVTILEHHMRCDVEGYPRREPRRPQHLSSRIVAIADTYDAMTSRRTYSFSHPPDEAMEVLARNSGTSFDPALVRMFMRMIGVYPPRSVVRLSSGEVAIVVGETDELLAPFVRVVTDSSSGLIEPFDVDLSKSGAESGRRVELCLDAETLNIDVDDYVPDDLSTIARPA